MIFQWTIFFINFLLILTDNNTKDFKIGYFYKFYFS